MTRILLSEKIPGLRLLGDRQSALALRDELESILDRNQDVVLDFTGIEATQSFVDELVGVLVFHHGPDIVNRIVFKGCSPNVRAIVEFVLTDRTAQYKSRRIHH